VAATDGAAAADGAAGLAATDGALAADGTAGADATAGGSDAASTASPLRQTINFNQSWVFQLGDYAGAQASTYDDTGWSPVNLPHSFSLPYFMWTQFYVGYGWYRKHFTMPAAWSGKSLSLEF
jgi:hypothetical protein